MSVEETKKMLVPKYYTVFPEKRKVGIIFPAFIRENPKGQR